MVDYFRVDDGKGRSEKKTHEVSFTEALVLPLCVGAFEFRHTDVVRKEAATKFGRFDALVTEFAQKAGIAIVDSSRYRPEIVDGIVHGVSVDVVDLEARRNGTDKGDVLDISKEFLSMPPVEP